MTNKTLFFTIIIFLSFVISGHTQKPDMEITPDQLSAGKPVVVEMEITAPDGGIQPGGSVLFPFYLKPWNGLIDGLTDNNHQNELVSVQRSDQRSVSTRNVLTNKKFPILSNLRITIENSPLKAGETLTIKFGTGDKPVRTTRKQLSLNLEAKLDATGDENYQSLSQTKLRVKSAAPEKLYLHGPSYSSVNKETTFVIYAEDQYRNICEGYTGDLTIYYSGRGNKEQFTYSMKALDQDKKLDRNEQDIVFDEPGIYYVTAEDKETGLRAVSNPVIVKEQTPQNKIYWGEIHVHSQISDGRGELEDVYRDSYIRGLDFIAITDHNFGRPSRGSMKERLQTLCETAEEYNRPGEFVTIPAGETHYFPNTHMNLYFKEADPKRMKTLLDRLNEADIRNVGIDTPEDRKKTSELYWKAFDHSGYQKYPLVFPHHTMWQGVSQLTNDKRQRTIEVISTHGSSEIRNQADVPGPLRMKEWRRNDFDSTLQYSVREMLDEGYYLGMVGGSDNHNGQAGADALTAVYASDLTRNAVLEAIYNRHTYATSANRAFMDFRIDELRQGQRGKQKSGRVVSCRVAGDSPIQKIEVINNGRPIHTVKGKNRNTGTFRYPLPENQDSGYFYIRTTMEGSEAVWSSPIWLE